MKAAMFQTKYLQSPVCVVWLVLTACLVAGCSPQLFYSSGQAWQRNACERVLDEEARRRCFEQADIPYDAYRREVDAATSGR